MSKTFLELRGCIRQMKEKDHSAMTEAQYRAELDHVTREIDELEQEIAAEFDQIIGKNKP